MENIVNNKKEIIATFNDLEKEAKKYIFSNSKLYDLIMEPITDWSESIKNELMRINPKLKTKSMVKNFLVQQDYELARLIGDNTLTKEECETKRKDLLTVFEDDEYFIQSIIDYDCDTTIWEMIVTYKPNNYVYIEWFNIGNW